MEENKITQEEQDAKTEKFPIPCYVFFALAFVAIIIYIIGTSYTPFADFFNRYIASIVRGTLATITNLLPLSLAEIGVICIPVILFFVIRITTQKYSSSWKNVGVFCLIMLSVLSLFFSLFVFSFGMGYHTSSLDKKLDLDKKTVSAAELAATAEWLIENVNAGVDNVEFADKSSSISPHSIREMNLLLLDSYDKLDDEYEFLPSLHSFVKPVMLSEPMTYTHISGVYTYFTGEANVNTNCPDYSMPYTAAHELAHQRGIAREDEANFIAFLVCTSSDDSYIKYCGYMNLLEYVLNALYSADKDLWEATYKKLDNRAIYEMIAYNNFYEPYRDNVIGEVSGAINDAYLQANGTEGSVSYGLVVDLAVAYFHKNIEN